CSMLGSVLEWCRVSAVGRAAAQGRRHAGGGGEGHSHSLFLCSSFSSVFAWIWRILGRSGPPLLFLIDLVSQTLDRVVVLLGDRGDGLVAPFFGCLRLCDRAVDLRLGLDRLRHAFIA